jgi:hypothetical protein
MGNQYFSTAGDGGTWEMHQHGAVDLAQHAGQTVEVKGTVSHEKMHNMPAANRRILPTLDRGVGTGKK